MVTQVDKTIALPVITAAYSTETIDVSTARGYSLEAILDVTTPSGLTIAVQKTNHPHATNEVTPQPVAADWTNVAAPTAVSADGTTWFEVVDPTYRAIRVRFAISGGSVTGSIRVLVRGDS